MRSSSNRTYQSHIDNIKRLRDEAGDDISRAHYGYALSHYQTALNHNQQADRLAQDAIQKRRAASHFQTNAPHTTVRLPNGQIAYMTQALELEAAELDNAAAFARDRAKILFDKAKEHEEFSVEQNTPVEEQK